MGTLHKPLMIINGLDEAGTYIMTARNVLRGGVQLQQAGLAPIKIVSRSQS